MLKERLRRRSAALAFVDVAGYSRLMGADEEATFLRWVALRRGLIEPRLKKWRGRVADRAGDGLLVEFQSVPDAARWALEVQAALSAGAEAAQMQVRIALHRGDVIEGSGGSIHGDAVNIAARLQAYADPGAIIASKAVVDELGGGIEAQLQDLGELHLHNILRPVHAFRLCVSAEGARPLATLPRRRHPAPSIAVLPFRHAPSDESYFADGIVEEIIRALAQLKELFVIAHSTTLRYTGAVPDPGAVAEELGVRYVLTGSVRRGEGCVRIATELIDAELGLTVWGRRFDTRLSELFALQDEISCQVLAMLLPHLRERELRRAQRKHPDSMDAYDLMLQGLDQLYRMDYAAFSRSRGLLQRAISLDPDYARPYAYVAMWHTCRVGQGWSPDPNADSEWAAQFATAALARDSGDALALAILGHVHSYLLKDPVAGAEYLARARDLSPSSAMAWALSSNTSTYLGHRADSIAQAEQALRLAPLDAHAFWYAETMALALYWAGRYPEAVAWAERSVRHNPSFTANLRCLVAGLMAVGREEDARIYAGLLLEVEPHFTIEEFLVRSPFQRLPDHPLFIDRLRASGLPERPGAAGPAGRA